MTARMGDIYFNQTSDLKSSSSFSLGNRKEQGQNFERNRLIGRETDISEPWCHIVGINSSPAPTCIDEMMGSKYGLTTSELYDHYGNRGHNAKVWHAIGIMLALLMSTVLLILVGILWRAEISQEAQLQKEISTLKGYVHSFDMFDAVQQERFCDVKSDVGANCIWSNKGQSNFCQNLTFNRDRAPRFARLGTMDPSTGIFTCSIPGAYLFSFHAIRDSTEQSCDVHFIRNGIAEVISCPSGSTQGTAISWWRTEELEKGAKISLQVKANSTGYSAFRCNGKQGIRFMGLLLRPKEDQLLL